MGRQRMFQADAARHSWISLMLLVTTAQETRLGAPTYLLSSSETHHILSGDIEVRYKVPATAPALRVQLIELGESKYKVLDQIDIPRNTTSGIVIFPCGLLVKPERTAFRLITIKGETLLAQTKTIDVKWPSVTVHVPLLVETYSSDVIVQLHLGTVRCKLRKDKGYSTYVDLVYEGPTITPSGEGKSVWHKPSVILSKELRDWLLQASYDVTLNCEYFDRAGYYKVRIRTETNSTPLVAESDTMHVIWSPRYSVSVTKSSVEPCEDSLKIIYHYPRCASDRDRLRVYGKMWRGVSKAPKYIFESRVHSGRHFTKLSCDIFGQDLQEYCFSFVSTAKSGAVFELDTQCIPRLAETDGLHPTWYEWGPWSDCSSTCGAGVHSRYRLCSSMKSIGCEGKSVQTEICNNQECPESSTVPQEVFSVLPPDCLCGCPMNLTEKMLLNVNFTDCQLPTYWMLQAWPSGRIILTILELFFPSLDHLLVVRDGGSPLGSVLAIYSNANRSEVLYSISSILRLEIFTPNATFFDSASMRIIVTPSDTPRESMAIIQTVPNANEYSLSTVHITMILLTAILCTAAIFLATVLYFRNIRQQMKGSTESPSLCSLPGGEQENGSPARQLLAASTSTSELSDSSLHRRSPDGRGSSPSRSPESYLHNSFLFRSLSSICAGSSSTVNTPTPKRLHFSSKVDMPASPTSSLQSKPSEEKVTPEFDASTKPLKSALKQRITVTNSNVSCSPSPVRRRGKPPGRTTRQIQRESTTPLTASMSELSMTGSEDGFEYDYYDYGCHDEPGSFFCPDPIAVGWPPFIPLPPEMIDDNCDLPLQHFTPSPTQDAQSTKS